MNIFTQYFPTKGFLLFIAWFAMLYPCAEFFDRNIDIYRDNLSGSFSENEYLTIKQSPDGHFYLDVMINSSNILMAIDTGASDIILNLNDAIKAGININSLVFNKKYITANGDIMAAHTCINKINIGNFEVQDILVAINKDINHVSLLGMNALKEFNINIKDDRMSIQG